MMTTRECKACDGSGLVRHGLNVGWIASGLCAACYGSGSITDHIPASDAIADAETLRNEWYASAVDVPQVPDSLLVFAPVSESARVAFHYAHAAFRAVPGLRG